MNIIKNPVALLVLVSGIASAQIHDIQAAFHSFTDSASFTRVTTVPLGTTIRWTAGHNAPHTVTSGSGSSDPLAGSLFQHQLSSGGASFAWTPQNLGSFDYFCQEHEMHGMSGVIHVVPPASRPGTGEDLHLFSGVNTLEGGDESKLATAGDRLSIRMTSTSAFVGAPMILAAQVFPSGMPPVSPFLDVHLSLPGAVILVGEPLFPFGAPLLPANGLLLGFDIPAGVAGTSILWQGAVLSPASLNGGYATTQALEIQIL